MIFIPFSEITNVNLTATQKYCRRSFVFLTKYSSINVTKGNKTLHAWMRLPAVSSEVKMKRGCQQRSTLLSDSGRKG